MDNRSRASAESFESLLGEFFAVEEPDEDFVLGLEQKLLDRIDRQRQCESQSWFRLRFRYALVALILAVGLVFVAAGPDQVWAALQQLWQQYVPGIGVVETDNTVHLEVPVTREESGVRFEVTEFVAGSEETRVRVRVDGLAEDAYVHPDSILVRGPNGDRLNLVTALYGPYLPGCGSTECLEYQEQLRSEGIRMVFEPLPSGSKSATVIWNVAGLVPGSTMTDQWRVEVPLMPVPSSEEGATEQFSYSVNDVDITANDISLRVERVFHLESRTIVFLAAELPEGAFGVSLNNPVLVDETGARYEPVPATIDLDEFRLPGQGMREGGQSGADQRIRLHFEPAQRDALRLTLSFESIEYHKSVEGHFAIALPEAPQDGQVILIDQEFDLGDVTLQVNHARFVRGTVEEVQAGSEVVEVRDQRLIEFDVDTRSNESELQVRSVSLGAGWGGPYWRNPEPAIMEGSGVTVSRIIFDPERLWSSNPHVHLQTLQMRMVGPWSVGWDLPR